MVVGTQEILSPLRLPIPPQPRVWWLYNQPPNYTRFFWMLDQKEWSHTGDTMSPVCEINRPVSDHIHLATHQSPVAHSAQM